MHINSNKPIRFLSQEDGAGTVFSLFLVICTLLVGGIAVDFANGERTHSQMQAAADAAAAAAITRLSDPAAARDRAIELATMNAPVRRHGNVLATSDVVFGHWIVNGGGFQPDQTPINAVRVTTRRAAANANALPTFLLRLVGRDTLEVSAQAIVVALPGTRNCSGGGLFSRRKIESGSNNTYLNGFCLYGERGVKIGSDTYFELGTRIEMPRLSDFQQSSKNVGVSDALRQATHPVDLPDMVPAVISAMESGNLAVAGLPSYITSVVYRNSISSSFSPVSGTLYIVNGVADIGSNRTLSNVAIVARREVKTGSNVRMQNVVFASRDKVLFGSSNEFGNVGFCETGQYSVHALSMENIEFGSQSRLRGLFLVSRDMIKFGSDNLAAEGVYAEASDEIDYGSDDTFVGCPDGLQSSIFEVDGEIALVQ